MKEKSIFIEIHRLFFEIRVIEESEKILAHLDVALDFFGIGDLDVGVFRCARQKLHDSDGPGRAAFVLIDTGFLISRRCCHQPINS